MPLDLLLLGKLTGIWHILTPVRPAAFDDFPFGIILRPIEKLGFEFRWRVESDL